MSQCTCKLISAGNLLECRDSAGLWGTRFGCCCKPLCSGMWIILTSACISFIFSILQHRHYAPCFVAIEKLIVYVKSIMHNNKQISWELNSFIDSCFMKILTFAALNQLFYFVQDKLEMLQLCLPSHKLL